MMDDALSDDLSDVRYVLTDQGRAYLESLSHGADDDQYDDDREHPNVIRGLVIDLT